MSDDSDRDELVVAARHAQEDAYAPYSGLGVGAALSFADGTVVTGSNVENASYGLSLCAETVAVAKAMGEGHRGGLQAVAVFAAAAKPVTPCGRCRQVLNELAALGDTDPIVWCANDSDVVATRLSALLPQAFGPDSLS
ncbi:cytidine deaminase [Croceicoccus estronivorus]|uniref:cytidine deaminase n=1 Tax=Croceicoccus estronivorus TaxID=1172626 RepID=UPI000831B0FC|nr:cytidine deaminase [Croceicoccus estronivorus]OCC25469.1 cytidine deaminase [Croceicoccus estronivorus]